MSRRKQQEDVVAPPHSVEAEQAILGAVLMDNSLFSGLSSLGEDDFYVDAHRSIFRTISGLIEAQDTADAVTVSDILTRSGSSYTGNWFSYLVDMCNGLVSGAAVPRYAQIVLECSIKRKLQAAWLDGVRNAGNGLDVGELVSLTQERIDELRSRIEEPEKRITCRPISWPELAKQEAPARQWLIQDWMGKGQPTLLAGPGGSGKSLISQQVGSCLAIGRTFIDQVGGPLRVLMWMCEDDHDELWRRQNEISVWLGVPLEEFAQNLIIVPRRGLDNTLMSTEYGRPVWTPLLDELRQQCGDYHADVWFGDNIAQLFGGNENDRHSVTLFANVVTGACCGATPVFIGHPSKAIGSEFSGSSGWENAVRMRWWFSTKLPDSVVVGTEETEDNQDVRYLCKRKTNYSVKDYRQLMYSGGVFVQSVAEEHDALRETQAKRAIIHAINRLADMGIFGSENPSRVYLPRLMIEYGLAEGLPKVVLAGAMRQLMVDGTIIKKEVGKNAAGKAKIALVVA